MVLTVSQLKEKLSCPIQLKLSPRSPDDKVESFKKVINLLSIWLDKRGSHMPISMVDTYIIKNFISDTELVYSLQHMTEQFWDKIYCHMEHPIASHRIEVEFGDHSLFDVVPILDRTDNGIKAYVFGVGLDPGKMIINRLLSIWAYYSIDLNIDITIINTNFDNNILSLENFKPTKHYVTNSLTVIKNMFKFVEKKTEYYPQEEICSRCPVIKYCTM